MRLRQQIGRCIWAEHGVASSAGPRRRNRIPRFNRVGSRSLRRRTFVHRLRTLAPREPSPTAGLRRSSRSSHNQTDYQSESLSHQRYLIKENSRLCPHPYGLRLTDAVRRPMADKVVASIRVNCLQFCKQEACRRDSCGRNRLTRPVLKRLPKRIAVRRLCQRTATLSSSVGGQCRRLLTPAPSTRRTRDARCAVCCCVALRRLLAAECRNTPPTWKAAL